VSRSWTTISCRALALCTGLLACVVVSAALPAEARGAKAGADKPPPPRLPLASFWTKHLDGAPSAPPVSDGDRVFIALKSAHLTARSVADGSEVWRISKDVTTPMAADAGLLFVSAGEAVEAVRAADGKSAWIVPRVKTVAPLIARSGWLIAVTETEIIAIHSKDGQVAWRHPAGGVRLPPDIDGDHLYTGATDGRVLALTLAAGAVAWETFLPDGITAIAARAGRVYAGAGDKQFYCLDGRSGATKWPRRIGSIVTGRIAVDDERVYFAALDNVVYALDRANGNQRWTSAVRRRPFAGVVVAGHVVFVPAVSPDLIVLYDWDGRTSGTISLPGEILGDSPPDIRETATGVEAFVVTGGLANDWQLTYLAPVDEAAIVPLSAWPALPGAPFLTDPEIGPIGGTLGDLILGDPPLRPMSAMGWPVALQDPPLEPLTKLPGLHLRPLSPVLPIRRGA
jgi:outer membrane protein assembly factor BamB